MEIIRAKPQHLEHLVPLVDAYRQFYKQPSNLEAVREYVKSRLENNQCVVFMAYEGSPHPSVPSEEQSSPEMGEGKVDIHPLGFSLLYHHWSTVALGHVWLLNDLFTTPEARRSGVGWALMEAARDFAKADGAKRIWLRTAVDNFAGQALYEKFGMVRDEQFYRYDLIF